MITARNQDRLRPEFKIGETVTFVRGRNRTRTNVRAISMCSPAIHATDIRYILGNGEVASGRFIAESTHYLAWMAEREPGAVVRCDGIVRCDEYERSPLRRAWKRWVPE